ncbi:hypothetical protein [Escherichia coli]|uniref:hypothetical protein n=1 Tax=Escherichia coli TaxID=562 RepID=UPI000F63E2ED|nr:hypothetical protein [Escherichia coli]QDM95961.1 hypothetical protein FNJ76_15885 [Escherichia coli]RRO71676.1 hypothetical protein AWF59_015930 [Escherichia coli]
MDNTILGALIGAVIAIVSTYINAGQGYKNSIRLERQKILRDKREQLFINCILTKKVIDSSTITILNFVKNARYHSDSKFDVSRANPLQTMEMLINIYLPEYKKDLQELNNAYQEFHKYYSQYTCAHTFKICLIMRSRGLLRRLIFMQKRYMANLMILRTRYH